MFKAIDHLVIAVSDLDTAIRAYSEAGFTVVRGGRHNIGTHNALIAFADGSYIELIAFLNAAPNHPWFASLARGGGIVDFCAQTDDLAGDVAKLRAARVDINDPNPMSRKRPDGYEVKWVLSIPNPPFNAVVPFWIKDQTPRDERVPRERSHRNGVTGIKTLTVLTADPRETARYYAAVLGHGGTPAIRDDLHAQGVVFHVGPHRIELLSPSDSPGAGPYEATLVVAGGQVKLDPARLLGARLRLAE